MMEMFNGVLLWGALYVVGVVVDAEMHGNRPAALMGIMCAGVTYLCYLCQAMNIPRVGAVGCFAASLVTGVLAGLLLLG